MTKKEAAALAEELAEAFANVSPRIELLLLKRFNAAERSSLQDPIQDVLLKLLSYAQGKKREREIVSALLSNPSHFRNYVAKAAAHRYVDYLRRSSREVQLDALLEFLRSSDSPEGLLIEEENAEEERKRAEVLRTAISELTEPYTTIFQLLLEDEHSLAEIARIRDVPYGSIYVQYSRGLEKLRQRLSG